MGVIVIVLCLVFPVHGCDLGDTNCSFTCPRPRPPSFPSPPPPHSPRWLAPPLTSPLWSTLVSIIFSRQAQKPSTNLALAFLTLPALHCTLSANLQVANWNALLHLLVASSHAFLELIGRMLAISISSRLELRPATSSCCDKFLICRSDSFPLVSASPCLSKTRYLHLCCAGKRKSMFFCFIFDSVVVSGSRLQVFINKV